MGIDRILPRLLNEAEAAEAIGVTPSTLAIWRSSKRYSLPYIKCGRLVRYREEDIADFLESRRVVSTSSPARTDLAPTTFPNQHGLRAFAREARKR
jgi:hypothetical protein